jgi:hypothetical protein
MLPEIGLGTLQYGRVEATLLRVASAVLQRLGRNQ